MLQFLRNGLKQSNLIFLASQLLENGKTFANHWQVKLSKDNGYARMYSSNGALRDDIYIKRVKTGFEVRRTVKNVSDKTIRLKELCAIFEGIDFGGERKEDYFYSIENPRIYEAFTFPIDYNRTEDDAMNMEFDVQANNRWADPGVVCERINRSPYQPFPAILLGNYQKKQGIVHGSLSQSVCYHNYLVSHTRLGIKLEIYSSFKDLDYIELESGRVIVDEWYIGETECADDFNHIFDGYVECLRKRLATNYGATDINRNSLVWGSWNDGIFRNVSHEMLIKEAKALKENFPAVKWFQLDDGYAVYNKDHNSTLAFGLGAPYERDGIDYEKFPQGMKAFADELREVGLRPALWIGGACPKDSKIYEEHPEWFCKYDRLKRTQPLDVSIPEAREYMTSALDTLISDYGFEAVKHDFWSYAFEDSGALYKNKDKSGYEYRTWWLQELRKRLPKDGYLQTGCDIVLGNPFLGEYFTNYRYGIDVADGNWDFVKTTMLWGVACFGTHTGDLFVPNSDAIGLLGGLNDTDFIFWINYVLITHSMVELSGRFALGNINPWRYQVLKKATANINNGQDVYFVGFDYRKHGRVLPSVAYTLTPHFSSESVEFGAPIRTLALFNFDESEKELCVDFKEMGLCDGEYVLVDIWSQEQKTTSELYKEILPAHGSKLYSVCKKREKGILDSNAGLKNIKLVENEISFTTPYDYNVELLVEGEIKDLLLNGKKIKYTQIDKKVTFTTVAEGNVQIIFRD